MCGQLAHSNVTAARLAPVVEAGIMPTDMVPDWINAARGLYDGHPQRQRDEAVRTGTFGAAAIVYAARSMGLGTTPKKIGRATGRERVCQVGKIAGGAVQL